MAKIRDISTEYFGSKETTRVLKALETSKIQIPSIEIFLFDSSDINDQSLQLYNTCKSIEEFVTKSIINFKKRAETGETEIEIKEFFFVLTDLFQTNELCSELFLKDLLKSFIISLITVRNKSPYVFTIIEPKWAKKVGEQLNLKTDKYEYVFRNTLKVIQEIMDTVKNIRAFLPLIKIVYPVYHDVRENQLSYLTSHFRLLDRPNVVKKLLKTYRAAFQDLVCRNALGPIKAPLYHFRYKIFPKIFVSAPLLTLCNCIFHR
jgi:hypothetical protein